MITGDLCTTPAYAAAQEVIRAKIKQRAEELAALYSGLSPTRIYCMGEEPAVLGLLNDDKKVIQYGIELTAHLVASGAAVIPDSPDDQQP